MVGVKQTGAEFLNEFSDNLKKVINEVVTLVGALKSNTRDLEEDMEFLKLAVGNTFRSEDEPSKVKVLEDKAYNESQNSRELENCLWDMEQYF